MRIAIAGRTSLAVSASLVGLMACTGARGSAGAGGSDADDATPADAQTPSREATSPVDGTVPDGDDSSASTDATIVPLVDADRDDGSDASDQADASAPGHVTDAGDAMADAADAGDAAPPATRCIPGARQCRDNQVVTCGSTGSWGAGVACAPSTPLCADGACGPVTTSCPSTGSGLTDCGPGESCCASLEVPGGTYYRTYTNSGGTLTGEADPASVSGFRLDKYEVTVGRFLQFVDAVVSSGTLPASGSGKHTHLNGGLGLVDVGGAGDGGATYEKGWDAAWNPQLIEGAPTSNIRDYGNWTDTLRACPRSTWQETGGNRPINCVNWWDAYAFCIWDGGFLPSEAEWEYAAAGGSQERAYPWGTAAPGTQNLYAIYACYYPAGMTSLCAPQSTDWSVATIAPVGTATLGAGLWGHLDLAGNLVEWVLDTNGGYTPCADCADLPPDPSTQRAVKGGGYRSNASAILPPYRYGGSPTNREDEQGFRCARTP
jgi:formylglycine-generating enzyme